MQNYNQLGRLWLRSDRSEWSFQSLLIVTRLLEWFIITGQSALLMPTISFKLESEQYSRNVDRNNKLMWEWAYHNHRDNHAPVPEGLTRNTAQRRCHSLSILYASTCGMLIPQSTTQREEYLLSAFPEKSTHVRQIKWLAWPLFSSFILC